MCVYVYMYMCMHVCIYVYVNMCVYMYEAYVCVFRFICVCVCVYMYAHSPPKEMTRTLSNLPMRNHQLVSVSLLNTNGGQGSPDMC